MDPSPLPPPTLVSERFEVVRAVAPAGAGYLHVALDRQAGRQVSLEVIATELAGDAIRVSALAHDLRAASSLAAPQLAKVIDAGADAALGVVWVALEPIEGEGLRARMARGPVSPRDTVAIVGKLLEALLPAHARGQVHRALSPEDVVLVPSGGGEGVVLLDFGLGKHVPSPAGSPYVSHEQARASGWVTPAADVFSVGAIAYELIVGKPPDPAGPTPVAQAAPGTPASIAQLVDKALAGDPGLRFASAKEMKAALDAALRPAQPVIAPAAPFAQPGGQPFGAPAGQPFGAPGGQPFGAQAGAASPFPMPRSPGLPAHALASPQQGGVVPPGSEPALAPPKQRSTTWMWVTGLVVLLGACLVLPVMAFVGLVAYGVSQAPTTPPYDPNSDPHDSPLGNDPFGGGGPLVPPADPVDVQPAPAAVDARYDVPVTSAQPQKGPPDALVTIVEFADYQCPFCARVAPTIDSLLEQYGNDVRFVWRDQPLAFHEHAEPAAEAAREAFTERGNAGYWQVHDLLYANQAALERGDLLGYTTQASLDSSAVRRAIDHHTYRSGLDEDSALGNRVGADGTPTFFINGRRVVGAQPREELARVIDEELASARRLVANGTPRDEVYATVLAGALERYEEPGRDPSAGVHADPPSDDDRIYALASAPDAPGLGATSAPVVVTEFADYQCPFCKRILPTLDAVRARYGRRVRVVWRDYPLAFHQNAMPAAEAAREALAQGGEAKFWRMHDLLYAHQDALERSDLEHYAQQLGLDMPRFRVALDAHTHQTEIQADVAAADATGAPMGTPTFFVNGHLIQGAQPQATFEQTIDRALDDLED